MSAVQICNEALTRYCGLPRITSLTEDRPEALQCNLHYASTLRALLEDHDWTFATRRRALALKVNDRPEWGFRYTRPNDALLIRWVNMPEAARIAQRSNHHADTPRETTADDIYCDTPSAVAEYTADITDTGIMPQSFRDAMAADLASRICQSLTESGSRTETAYRAAVSLLEKAKIHDMRNRDTPTMNQTPAFLTDRGL